MSNVGALVRWVFGGGAPRLCGGAFAWTGRGALPSIDGGDLKVGVLGDCEAAAVEDATPTWLDAATEEP